MSYGQEWREWVASVRPEVKESAVPETHKPTANELNNVVHLCFKQVLGTGPRVADHALLGATCPDVKDMSDLRSRYIPALAEYVWDHWMGEPEDPTVEDVELIFQLMSDILFTMSENVRNDINDVSDKAEG